MKKVILLVVVLAVITAGWFLYFRQSDPITEVTTARAKITDLGNTLEFSGQVTPVHMYSAMSDTGGTVNKLYVKEGDEISAGDKLFALDTSALEAQLKEAQLQYDMLSDAASQSVMAQNGALSDTERALQEQQIKVALALSQTTGYDYESFNSAFADTAQGAADEMAASLSGMTLDDLPTVSASSNATIEDQLAMAELSVQTLKDAIAKMSVTSLIDGTVVAVNIHEGEVLAPGIPALVIADTYDTVVDGYVYEKDVKELAEGQKVKIYTEEGYYWGTLTAIGKAAGVGDTSEYGTMTKVEVTPDGSFSKMPGAVVDLEIVISSKTDVLSVPLEAITDDGNVFVVNAEGNAEKRVISTGFRDLYNVEVLSGLSAGEEVILSPKDIEEGQQVEHD